MRGRAFALFMVTSLLVACLPEFGDDLSIVRAPRILAVKAVPAEAKAGSEVQLSALVADPSSEAAPPRIEWALCLARKPLTELGPVAQECIERFGAGGDIFVRLGNGTAVSADVPIDACRRFGPSAPPAEAGGAAGRPVDPDLTGGYHQPVILGAESGTSLGSVRLACGITGVPSAENVRFTQGYRPNENPAVDRLEASVDGEPPIAVEPTLRVRPGSRVDLRAMWAACAREPVCGDGLCTSGENQKSCPADCRDAPRGCTGAETYLWADPEARIVSERREGIVVRWYATGGVFDVERTGRTESDPDGIDTTNVWTAPRDPVLVRMWLVIRDDRGGVGWNEYRVDVAP